jgi:hypothetical protein
MAKRAPSTTPRTRRTRTPADETPAQAADTAIASTTETTSDASESTEEDLAAADTGPSEDEIRDRAYHRYLERGGNHGQDFDDWVEAERELRSRKSQV